MRFEGRPMIALKTHLLVYPHREDSLWHKAAYACVPGLTVRKPLLGSFLNC